MNKVINMLSLILPPQLPKKKPFTLFGQTTPRNKMLVWKLLCCRLQEKKIIKSKNILGVKSKI